jgi:hypothetical protein
MYKLVHIYTAGEEIRFCVKEAITKCAANFLALLNLLKGKV